jgi:phenylalanyl-tRNA synthetase alpha chain
MTSIDELKERTNQLRTKFEAELSAAKDAPALQALRDRFLGRKAGEVTALFKELGKIASEAKKEAGFALNSLKELCEAKLGEAGERVERSVRESRLGSERIDVSLPGRPRPSGGKHPLTLVREEVEDVFIGLGFDIFDGPEVDDDFHCFEALNMPADHPARDMQDTFYLEGAPPRLLRTHTSTGQIRSMLTNENPPVVRVLCPGRTFRRDDDITHSPMFHQFEGLVVNEGITLGDLMGTLETFIHAVFGKEYPVRFRPSYFPYTEPSVEVDMGCSTCKGRKTGCRVCKETGWLEILGSGMVHPAVFEAVNRRLGKVVYDPEKVSGFAFGSGIERIAMIKYGISDIRLFYESDLRFLEQFA